MSGSGGPRSGTANWSTFEYSGRVMVRVLGHRCSIVDNRIWLPFLSWYFRVKPLGSRFSFIWMFDHLFVTTIRLPSSLWEFDYRRLAAACFKERYDYRWNSCGKLCYIYLNPWPTITEDVYDNFALRVIAMHSKKINCSQQLGSWVDKSFGTNWSPINDYLYRYHGREFWRSLTITQLVRNLRGEIVINLDQHGILPWLWALSYMRARQDSHLYRQLPIVLYLPW